MASGLCKKLRSRWLIAALATLVAIAGAGLGQWVGTPSTSDVQARVDAIAAHHGVGRMTAPEVPSLLAEALIATEDERFYEHHGIDVLGLARALSYDLRHTCPCEGGSTISEQLVKVAYLDSSDAGWHKIEEVMLSFKVERVLSKREILADYFSIVLFGYGLYGADAASCAYFGRHPSELTLGQAALLAGMPRSPSLLDPRRDPAAARGRRHEVLASMVDEGDITAAQAAAANTEPVLGPGSGCSPAAA